MPKTVIVPAQITSYEDRITEHLSLTQVCLLFIPLVVIGMPCLVLPPFLKIASYKLMLFFIIYLPCAISALRIKNVLVLHYGLLLLRYRTRSHCYTYAAGKIQREPFVSVHSAPEPNIDQKKVPPMVKGLSMMATEKEAQLQWSLDEAEQEIMFKRGKGGILHAAVKQK